MEAVVAPTRLISVSHLNRCQRIIFGFALINSVGQHQLTTQDEDRMQISAGSTPRPFLRAALVPLDARTARQSRRLAPVSGTLPIKPRLAFLNLVSRDAAQR